MRDLCLEELAIARSEHLHATRSLLADLLDLRHRLPRVRVAVQALRIEPWVARTVASMSRRLTRDAVALPYDPLGPPGQTGDHNDAPLDRHSHRARTHLDYQVQQLAPATYLWTSPSGLHRLVNHTGTHPISDDDLDLIRRLYAAA